MTDLTACKALGERVNAASSTMGVAMTSCTVPAAGKPKSAKIENNGAYRFRSRRTGIDRQWAGRGLTIARSLVGNHRTLLEMPGCSITLTKLDEEMKELSDAPVHTAVMRRDM